MPFSKRLGDGLLNDGPRCRCPLFAERQGVKQRQGLVGPAGPKILLVAQYQADLVPVFEIVINGVDREAIENAMRAGIHAACQVPGILKITAANYEGKLGIHHFPLHSVLE